MKELSYPADQTFEDISAKSQVTIISEQGVHVEFGNQDVAETFVQL